MSATRRALARIGVRARCALAALAMPLLLLGTLLAPQAASACASGGCVMAGPRLASVSSAQGALLNALLGQLTGSSLTLGVGDWNAIATGNVSLLKTLNALQATLGVANTQTALNTPITIAQLAGAASTAASQAGDTALSVALGNLAANVSAPGTIRLGDLLTSDGLVGNTAINAMQLVSGAVQLFNDKNVATTTAPVTVSGASLGLGGTLTSVKLWARAVEPPAYVCGPVGSTFHTSALRVKLSLTLLQLTPATGALNALPDVGGTSVTLGQIDLYVEVAHASGIITAVNAITNAMTVQATPGIASLYLGAIPTACSGIATTPSCRRPTSATGRSARWSSTRRPSRSSRRPRVGSAPSPTTFTFSGSAVQTQTATTVAGFETSLLSSLLGNLSISVTPSLGLLDAVVLPVLNTLVQTTISPVLATVASALVDPLLNLIGVRLGEVDVTSGGEYLECALSGCVYADPNHNARQDAGETGTGNTLYAKLVAASAPTVVAQLATVDPTTGNYAFAALNPAAYTVVISTSNSMAVVAPVAPAGWIGTESPTLSRAITMTTADLVNQRFGLFHGSSIGGTIFKDNGVGGGIANNGLKDGGETAIGGTLVSVTDATGATVYDSQRSDPTGAYVLWVASTAGTGVLKVAQAADATVVVVSGRAGNTGGAFAAAGAGGGATTSFTHVIGSVYTGVDFGDVPINRLDTDGQQSVAAGTTALFPHVSHAGSAGQLSLALAPPTPPPTGWSATIWLDANCNGLLDAGETPLTAATTVVADQALCVIVKVFVPETAPNDARTAYALTASFAYANNTLTATALRQDLTIVGTADGLRLVKSVDKAVAVSGTVIIYTIAFTNQGAGAVTAVRIRDATPAWTQHAAAACGTLPAGITACVVTAQPAVGASGTVEWTLTGSLASGASGTVQFSVQVQ